MGKVLVKTVYDQASHREPNTSTHDSIEEAQAFIDTCLRWGIGIVSCEIIPDHS